MEKVSAEMMEVLGNIYKKTIAYDLDKIVINDDGTTTHIHSDAFLENHPERRDSPQFTEEEEIEEVKFIAEMAKRL